MKTRLLILVSLLSISRLAAADDLVATETGDAAKVKAEQRYFVTLSEYRLPNPIATSLVDTEIVELINEQKLEPIETLRVSNVSETESLVQFAKRVSVITGKVTNRDGISHVKQMVQIGTSLRITTRPHESGVEAKIVYESSRFHGEGSDDSPPDTVTMTCNLTQVVRLETPTLIAASSAGDGVYVLLTITEIP
jgi:hypothetical protein